MNTPNPDDRAFLEHFPAERRSFVSNWFLTEVRAGRSDPNAVVRAVRERLRLYINRYDSDPAGKYCLFLDELDANPSEALRYARWSLDWERMTPEQKARHKAQRNVEGINLWMETQEPSEKQIALLTKLGHAERPASKAEASRLIDALLKAPRTQPQTAFGRAVMEQAGIGTGGPHR